MRRTLAIAIGFSVLLLVAPANALNWVTWHCPYPGAPPTCDSLGKAHYMCNQRHFFSSLAQVDADGDSIGPPSIQCPTCGFTNKVAAYSVLCHNFGAGQHGYYAPSWTDYNYYIP